MKVVLYMKRFCLNEVELYESVLWVRVHRKKSKEEIGAKN